MLAKCRGRGSISGSLANSTKASGWMDIKKGTAFGKDSDETPILDSGRTINQMVSENICGAMVTSMKVNGRPVSGMAREVTGSQLVTIMLVNIAGAKLRAMDSMDGVMGILTAANSTTA